MLAEDTQRPLVFADGSCFSQDIFTCWCQNTVLNNSCLGKFDL